MNITRHSRIAGYPGWATAEIASFDLSDVVAIMAHEARLIERFGQSPTRIDVYSDKGRRWAVESREYVSESDSTLYVWSFDHFVNPGGSQWVAVRFTVRPSVRG